MRKIATSFQECGPIYLFFNDERDLLLAISMGILFKLCLHGIGILFWITYPMVHYPKEIDIFRSNDFSWQAFINKPTHLWYYVMPIIYSNILGPLWLVRISFIEFFWCCSTGTFFKHIIFLWKRGEPTYIMMRHLLRSSPALSVTKLSVTKLFRVSKMGEMK